MKFESPPPQRASTIMRAEASIFSAAADAEAGNAAGGAVGDDGATPESAYQTSKRASANVGELLAQGRVLEVSA